MAELRLIGHQDAFGVATIMRLFFGEPVTQDPQMVQAGQGGGTGSSQVSRLDRPDGAVRVQTAFGASRISRTVAPAARKREIGRQLYAVLSRETGLAFPWGALTGIRPTLIAAEELAAADGQAQAARERLQTHWFVSPEKAALAVQTAQAEETLLAGLPRQAFLVYLGIPFCPSRCSYCSFITRDAPRQAPLLDAYVSAVVDEWALVTGQNKVPVSALYLGGGTPTSLSAEQLDRLLAAVLDRVIRPPDLELTVEAGRPDTIDAAKLAVLRRHGFGRICINPQTFHDQTLKRIGRHHTVAQVRQAFDLARQAGFNSINMDLIAGLPGETLAAFDQSLDQVLELGPEAVTVHTLTLKRSAALFDDHGQAAGPLGLRPDVGAMLSQAHRRLGDQGYAPYYLYRQKRSAGGYENTGFARPGQACAYNVGMMSDRRHVLGIGSGAASKRADQRAVQRLTSPRDLQSYLARYPELARQKRQLFNWD